MNNGWKEVTEEGQVFYLSETLGNIQKLADGVYVSFFPKIIKLGPFTTLEAAQDALMNCKNSINGVLDQFNSNLVSSDK